MVIPEKLVIIHGKAFRDVTGQTVGEHVYSYDEAVSLAKAEREHTFIATSQEPAKQPEELKKSIEPFYMALPKYKKRKYCERGVR